MHEIELNVSKTFLVAGLCSEMEIIQNEDCNQSKALLWPFAEGIKEHREEPQPEYSIS
jgi:hypothetical protein